MNVEDAAGSLPESLRSSDELSNLVQLLFVMAQRKGVPKSMFLEAKQHYARILQDNPGISASLTAFESCVLASCCSQKTATGQPDGQHASKPVVRSSTSHVRFDRFIIINDTMLILARSVSEPCLQEGLPHRTCVS